MKKQYCNFEKLQSYKCLKGKKTQNTVVAVRHQQAVIWCRACLGSSSVVQFTVDSEDTALLSQTNNCRSYIAFLLPSLQPTE